MLEIKFYNNLKIKRSQSKIEYIIKFLNFSIKIYMDSIFFYYIDELVGN